MTLTRLGLNQAINLATNVTGTLATGNGGTSATSFTAGKVLQVVTGTITNDNFVTSSTPATLLTVNITPSATTSKVFVTCAVQYNNYGNGSSSSPNGS